MTAPTAFTVRLDQKESNMGKILSLIVCYLLFKLMEWWYAHAYGQSDELMGEEKCDWYPKKGR
jgi:hypothetical protein